MTMVSSILEGGGGGIDMMKDRKMRKDGLKPFPAPVVVMVVKSVSSEGGYASD